MEQLYWSIGLIICWLIVAYGQYHQGRIIKQTGSCDNVSFRLPLAVFTAQLILLVKGIYYYDWSLISGCIIVNASVSYNLYQIVKTRLRQRKH